MKKSIQYKINSPNVIHEMIDGEVVIVNLDKGHYYSLRNSGAEIWIGIVAGMSSSEIVNNLSQQYDGEHKEIEEAVNNLSAELESDELIISHPAGEVVEVKLKEDKLISKETKLKKFVIPVLEKYTDMEELLLLDPIHEVDETGWPNMAIGTAEEGTDIEG